MKTLIFDFSQIENISDFYAAFKKKFDLPEYFGDNLDAVYDMLTGYISLPVAVAFENLTSEKQQQFERLIDTFEDAVNDLGNDFSFSKKLGQMETKKISWEEYSDLFQKIVDKELKTTPYDDPMFYDYTKLNLSRSSRWLKQDILNEETKYALKNITQKQQWIVITEPWCGDAAHIVPVVYKMSLLNPNIDFKIELRDDGSEIDNYLTNGKSKSIPILIVRNKNGNDLFHWGPRPKAATEMFAEFHKEERSFEETKVALQNWYNQDKSVSTQKEISDLLKSSN